jgi:hypothetical protein
MKCVEFVVRAEYFLLDPDTIKVCFDQACFASEVDHAKH